ncbi:TPA: YaaC family protein [Vibrio cholerae]|uniref:YaaC family protein n=1 Tax=Vibrio cholerae TaxID=666 RepID=UPI001583CF6D|nr:YaaC family protein [Vibrio cholerae]ELJ8616660.1 hypothetical protein [Vibrio cholerae]QKU87379.1 hypothetical protein HPY06_14610 [Vibrio cholerae]
MDSKVWQELLVLESRDAVDRLYTQIHNRKLSVNRTIAINNAAKQAREYFRNAFSSNYSVRPLLTFYGVASLSRALILLLKSKGGEETLTAGHGLTADDWRKNFSGELHKGLEGLLDLKVHLCKGLFVDLLEGTNNMSCVHVNSSRVNWTLNYDKPESNLSMSFGDILTRLPDLTHELKIAGHASMAVIVDEMTYNAESGLNATVSHISECVFEQFVNLGYEVVTEKNIKATVEVFSNKTALFTHSFLNKEFGSIPRLAISPPVGGVGQLSEICLLYISSFYMSMLVRYFPTYWVSLVQGGKGDVLWPAIYKAQQLVENTFPELVMELIEEMAKPKT